MIREQNSYNSYIETFLEDICSEMAYDLWLFFIIMIFYYFHVKWEKKLQQFYLQFQCNAAGIKFLYSIFINVIFSSKVF